MICWSHNSPERRGGLISVIKGLIRLSPRCIRFPYNVADQLQFKRDFHVIAGLPNITGAIDCTHVHIKAPSTDEFGIPLHQRPAHFRRKIQPAKCCCSLTTAQLGCVLCKVRVEMGDLLVSNLPTVNFHNAK